MSDLLTVAEAAKFIGVTDKAIYLAIEKERIRPVRLLGKLGITLDDAKAFKKARRQTNGHNQKKAA